MDFTFSSLSAGALKKIQKPCTPDCAHVDERGCLRCRLVTLKKLKEFFDGFDAKARFN